MHRLALGLFLLVCATVDADDRPRVFVTIDSEVEKDLAPPKRKELADSVRDLRDQLSKRPTLRTAQHRAEADILVEILDRRIEVGTTGQTDWGGGMTQTHYQSRYVLASRVRAGAVSEETETALAGAFVTWKRVAGVVARDIESWAEVHKEELPPKPGT